MRRHEDSDDDDERQRPAAPVKPAARPVRDDLEAELENELDDRVDMLRDEMQGWKKKKPIIAPASINNKPALPSSADGEPSKEGGQNGQPTAYDDSYFDSDDENAATMHPEGSKGWKNHRQMTDEELFYDPGMDDDDEKWMRRQRRAHLNIGQIACVCDAINTLYSHQR